MDQVDEMLAELQQAGLLDSHGQFSIDFVQALQRMGKQLLPDARMYGVRFYQAAVCSGATDVSYAGNQSRLHCRSLGMPLPLAQLRELSRYLAPDARNLAAHYLASALHAALSTKPRRLQLVTWDGTEGASLTFRQNQESLQVLDSCPFANQMPQTGLMVERGPAWFFRQVPEWEWLRRQAGVGRASLRINGQVVAPAFGAPQELVAYKLYLPGSYVSVAGDGTVGLVCRGGHHVFLGQLEAVPDHPQEDRIVLPGLGGVKAAIGIRADLAPKASLRFVRHGVMLPAVHLKAPAPGLEILISAHGYQTDLSGLGMVENDAYHEACGEMLRLGERLWTQVRRNRSYRDSVAQELLDRPSASRHQGPFVL